MFQLYVCCFLLYLLLGYSFQNSSFQLCHHDDKIALLQFKNKFAIDPFASLECGDWGSSSYPKTKYWKEKKDWCLWDGVTCHTTSGRVIELDLSCSQLVGVIHQNSTLFYLNHLKILNLAYNEFYQSHIPRNMAHLASLKVLNLSSSNFKGNFPINFNLLSQLLSLDLSHNHFLEMHNIDKIMRNLNSLRELVLSGVNIISPTFPQTITNLSSLTSLKLCNCNLQGFFPSNVLSMPYLQSLIVCENNHLYVDASHFNNMSSSLQLINFSLTNLLGRLPKFCSLRNQPPQLSSFHASECNLYGAIPTWIWNTTKSIYLSLNHLSGKLTSYVNTKQLSNFSYLNLEDNFVNGPIPSWLINLPSLKTLSLSDNQFAQKVPFHKHNYSLEALSLGYNYNNLSVELDFLSKCSDLAVVDLSYTSVTEGVNSTFTWPNLSFLYMSSCNITSFPNLLSYQSLHELDLSNNKIQGEIPTWFFNVGNSSLMYLNIFHNILSGGLNLLSLNSLEYIDLRSNSLQVLLPLPPPKTTLFLASNNNFHGELTSSFCHLKELTYVDLSNNHLNGTIPKCFGKLSLGLQVLDMGFNLFNRVIHITFTEGCEIKSIHLNNNNFEGKLPRSLFMCKQLEVLERNNRSNYSFPHWLNTLPELKVLVLRSINFRGSIKDDLRSYKHSFSKLQILDLSNNQFYEKLPLRFFKMFKALTMDNRGGHNKDAKYRLTFLEVFNVSKNQLEGPIPQGNQFNTFLNNSYEGNLGLCGDPLQKCGESGSGHNHHPVTQESEQEGNGVIDIITSISLLEIILLGFGLGVVLGSSIGYCMLSSRKPNWLLRKADMFEGVMMQHLKHSKRQRRST